MDEIGGVGGSLPLRSLRPLVEPVPFDVGGRTAANDGDATGKNDIPSAFRGVLRPFGVPNAGAGDIQ
jgi:hypothetical protein